MFKHLTTNSFLRVSDPADEHFETMATWSVRYAEGQDLLSDLNHKDTNRTLETFNQILQELSVYEEPVVRRAAKHFGRTLLEEYQTFRKVQSQEQVQDHEQLDDSTLQQLADRKRAIDVVLLRVSEFTQIFKEMHIVIEDQDEQLDRIENHIEHVVENVKSADEDLIVTETEVKCCRLFQLKLCLCVVVPLLSVVVTIVLVVSVMNK